MFASNNYARVKERLREIDERRQRIDAIMARRRVRRRPRRSDLLTISMISREAVRLFRNASLFLRQTEEDYEASLNERTSASATSA